jgi:hypothetical protein
MSPPFQRPPAAERHAPARRPGSREITIECEIGALDQHGVSFDDFKRRLLAVLAPIYCTGKFDSLRSDAV